MTAAKLMALGYSDLVSVIPPDALLSQNSKIKNESRGKAPGVKYTSGWGGYNWASQKISPAEIDASGANIGLASTNFPAIDVDVRDEGLANLIAAAIESFLPAGPIRFGLPPKRLYLFRLDPNSEPFSKMQLVIDYNDEKHLVEVLGAGQQYVLSGLHAKSKQPYTYSTPLPPADELPTLNLQTAKDVLQHIADEVLDPFGIAYKRSGSGSVAERKTISQDHLKADIADLAIFMSYIPNSESMFASRQDYIRLGYALRAASQDDPDTGLQLFQEWAAKKDWGEPNDPKTVLADWKSFRGPFEIGVEFIEEMARKFGYGSPGDAFDLEDAPPPAPRPAPGTSALKVDARYSDMWLTDKLIERVGREIVWQPQRGKWLAYARGIWREDTTGAVSGYAREICIEEANVVASQGATDRERKEAQTQAKAMSSSKQLESILRLAKQDGRVIVQHERFDANPDLLGTPAGVVDLRTGELINATPEMYISKSTSVAPGPPSPLWRQFLDDASGGDLAFEEYLQKVAGYCLTAHTYENLLFFLWGEGKRGKSTFVDTISAVMGSYAKVAQMSTFIAKKQERHTTELAALAGARLVTAQETQENEYWDEARIKSLTGGDSVTARFLFQDDFTFVPGFKLLFSGNSRPRIQNPDTAMRRRVHLIPFVHLPKNPDQRFKDRLKQEGLPGVLSWMIEGVIKWRRDGLVMPESIDLATSAYFEQEDPFGRWVKDATKPKGSVSAAQLYQSWTGWCDAHSESASTQRKFVTQAMNRGLRRGPDEDGQMMFVGISLKERGTHVGEDFMEERVVVQ